VIALIVGSTAPRYRSVFLGCSWNVFLHVLRDLEQDMRSALRIGRAAYEKVLSAAPGGAGIAESLKARYAATVRSIVSARGASR
jgi:hypothetical protein